MGSRYALTRGRKRGGAWRALKHVERTNRSVKLLANKRDVPYQSLIKLFLAERIKREFEGDAS